MTVTDGGERTDPVAVAHERYVAGELDELALERELEAALADADGPRGRPAGEGEAHDAGDVEPDTFD